MATTVSEKLREYFRQNFGKTPEVLAQAPGRINIIGEHIDYNDGYVMPVAIDKYIRIAAGTNGRKGHFRIHALDLNESVEWTGALDPSKRPLWLNFIYGSLAEWTDDITAAEGLDMVFSGDIPTGAGLSSSAALEACSALAIARLWGIEIDKKSLALHCQKVEHQYVGVKCGIMDQYASIFGEHDRAILLDCLTISHTYLPLNLTKHLFLLCNTGVTHSLASSGYNERRSSCEKVFSLVKAGAPEISSWREVTIELLQAFRSQLSLQDYHRAIHVIQEIRRVKDASRALQDHDLKTLGNLMYQSHADLSEKYDVSCVELDFLVEEARKEPAILGSRMMGGGFGGCTLNLIEENAVEDFVERVSKAYRDAFNLKLECYFVHSGQGAHVITQH